MAKGKLTNTEKYTIQGMLHDSKSIVNIAKTLGRTKKIVERYIDKDLGELVATITKARNPASDIDVDVKDEVSDIEDSEFEADVSEDMYEAAMYLLRNAGLEPEKARELLDRTIQNLNFDPDNERQLYRLALRHVNAHDAMITRAAGGRKGVTAMTKAASERIDSSKEKPVKKATSRRNRLYNPKTRKMM